MSLSTVYNLVESLGFHYKVKQKTYYTDRHEHPEVQKYRAEFCKAYLESEIRMYRWIQLHSDEYKQYADKIGVASHISLDGKTVEVHVDQCPEDLLRLKVMTDYGGNLSLRKPDDAKPLASFGQDEAIIKQNLLPNKQWVGPNGERALLPKDDGYGVMYSIFQSREFGFFPMTNDQLNRVNLERAGKKYRDSTAVIRLRGSDDKKDLKTSPFVRSLDYGVNNDGYWSYDNIAEQFEDCVDCIKTLHGNDFDFTFMFDQSSGHCKKQDEGLNVNGMNKDFGGRQKRIRDTRIERQEGYLGPFQPSFLKPGDTQHFTFREEDDGPYYLEDRSDRKIDRIMTDETRSRKRLKRDLQQELTSRGISVHGSDIKAIRELCIQHEIPTEIIEPKIIEGWMGKEKGLDQSCWERGLTDPNKTYKVDELKDILSACTDFQQETSQLQKIGGEVGVNVTYSPKCHPENSGEGIEFIWALIKNKYRRIPFSLKPKAKEAFLKDVAKLVHDTPIEKVRKSSKRARQYICAYNEIHNGTFQGAVPMTMIEKYKNTSYKYHRGVLISDVSFVEAEK